jgi:hypothetical protein
MENFHGNQNLSVLWRKLSASSFTLSEILSRISFNSPIRADTDHVTVHRNAVSSTWDMAKDGKAWFDPIRQREISERIAARRARLLSERKSLQARLLAKWRAK